MRQQAHKIEAQRAAAQKRADQLEGVVVEVAAKVSATGVLYGSVNKNIVAEELAKKGFDIDRKIITMHDIKTVGEYEALVHFFKGIEVKLPVKVVAENQEVAAPVEEEKPVEKEVDIIEETDEEIAEALAAGADAATEE